MIRDLVEYAAQVANGLLVPTDFRATRGAISSPSERFYVRMLDMEAKGATKVADFQNFAKSFAYGDYATLMASTTANAASLAGAADLKGRMLDGRGLCQDAAPASAVRGLEDAWRRKIPSSASRRCAPNMPPTIGSAARS